MADTYRSIDVTVSFNGIPLSGFDEGEFILAERNEQAYTLKVGSGGEAARAASGNKSGTITVTLMATSKTNAALTAIAVLDEQTGDGVGMFSMVDLSGQDVVKADEAWIQKRPAAGKSNEVGSRVWVFETGNLDILVAGNAAEEV